MEKNCKGFAYMKESEKFQVVYGDTEQEILGKLAGWNKARVQEMQYVYCNIGSLGPETGKYGRYQKYDVATGKNISSLELKIPSMSKEEFLQTTKEFKEKGAKFNHVHRRWYVSPDNPNMDYFSPYVVDKQKQEKKQPSEEEKRVRNKGEVISGKETPVEPGSSEHSKTKEAEPEGKQEYAPELASQFKKITASDKKLMDIEQEKLNLMQELVEKDLQINGKVSEMTSKILDAYGAEIRFMEQGKPWVDYKHPEQSVAQTEQAATMPEEKVIEREEYTLSISKEAEDNRCTIYYKDGRLPVDLRGDQFNVHFPSLSEERTLEIVQEYNNRNQEIQRENGLDLQPGDQIDVYRQKAIPNPEDPNLALISGISRIKGTVESVSIGENGQNVFMVNDGKFKTLVDTQEVYSDRQADVLLRVVNDKLTPEKFNVVANPNLDSAQMEVLRTAFKDGFSLDQVQAFADPQIKSWQMDLCRYGMQHGIRMEDIQKTYTSADKGWSECRQEVDGLIRSKRQHRINDLDRQGFQADAGIIKRMERIDHMTGRENSLKDLCNAFKAGTYKDSPAGDLINELGKEFQYQEMQRAAEAMVPEP